MVRVDDTNEPDVMRIDVTTLSSIGTKTGTLICGPMNLPSQSERRYVGQTFKLGANLESLDGFNERRQREHDYARLKQAGIRKNGIACPECGSELIDSNPDMTLTSSPPKKSVHCGSCSFMGYRLA